MQKKTITKKQKWTAVVMYHYFRLFYRSALFIGSVVSYILFRFYNGHSLPDQFRQRPALLLIMWFIFVLEMTARFFPSELESPGSQKQFRQNYIKTGQTDYRIQDNHGTVLVALIWIVFNGVFGALHMMGVLDDGILLLLCSAYSICDMVCILFYCPFQSIFLRNKCCCTCRIYNWDYAMMFTPLFFVRSWYTWSLLGLSVALLLRWEITFYRFPERFAAETNGYLSCANCTEKLCRHKTQLHALWKSIAEATARKLEMLRKE